MRPITFRNWVIYGAWGSVVVKLNRTVPGSIPGGVTGFFSAIFPSDRTMALWSTKAPSENEYQEHLLGVKVAGA